MAGTIAELIQEGKDITIHLTDTEKDRLKACEQVIEKGFDTFLEVGRALAEIRDNRLYRATHKAFERYCREVWDLGKSKAYYQIAGSETICFLKSKTSTIVDTFAADPEQAINQNEIILPTNEAQTRPLTKLKPDDQVKAWGLVLEQLNDGKKLTSAVVKKAVKVVRGGAIKRNIDTTKQALDSTDLVSKNFLKQYNVLLEIISEEHRTDWKTTSRKEAVKYLKLMVKAVEDDN
ncbi:MAG: hypothetical protein KOO65_05380 [Desulfobacterales bacterium]|nr:hypothetical protein [Desulfobacterales bacterium]